MNPRTTGILAVLALALGLFVWFHEIEGDVARQAVADEENRVFSGFVSNDIDAVALTTLDGVDARFERRDGRWWLVDPRVARADATALDAITNALANLPKEGSLAGGKDPVAFELGTDPGAPGFARRIVGFEVAGESLGLRVGRTTPVGGHRYVARLADDDVAYVESFRVNAFERNLSDLRDRSVFTFASDDVERISVTGSEGREVILVRENGTWRLVAPFEALADQEVARDLVTNLAHLRARDFVDDPEAIEASLRAETAVRLAWRLSGEQTDHVARLAGTTGDARLFETSAGDWILVAEERVGEFATDADAYRFKRLADFDLASARRLELHFAEEGTSSTAALDVVAELREVGWASDDSPLDPDRMTRLVRELSNLRATGIFADEVGEAESAALGLSPPRARLRVEGGSDRERPTRILADLRFGRFDPTRGLLVQRDDMDTVFVIEPELADGLPYSAAQYRFAFETPGPDAEEAPPEVDPLEGVSMDGVGAP
ncbi:MAG: DUF4340 domain-containing protein [Myxococcota bacterium]